MYYGIGFLLTLKKSSVTTHKDRKIDRSRNELPEMQEQNLSTYAYFRF